MFTGKGVEEGELKEASENVKKLISEYKESEEQAGGQ